MKTDNKILELSFDFSLKIIELYKKLIDHKEFVISKQLLKSGTSIGANIEEALLLNPGRILFQRWPSPRRKQEKQDIG